MGLKLAPTDAWKLHVLLENGACPDAAGREGVTALELLLRKEREESADAEWIRRQPILRWRSNVQMSGARPQGVLPRSNDLDDLGVLRRNRATLEATQEEHEARIIELRRSFGIKMVGALLTLQSPTALPAEVLEALHLLFRDLPKEVVKESLEPQAYCALAALLQHLVSCLNGAVPLAIGAWTGDAVFRRWKPVLGRRDGWQER
eukprot:s1115_g9.t1